MFLENKSVPFTGCFGDSELDGQNSDRLFGSIQAIAKDMPEIERQQFGQDILLLYAHSVEDFDRISLRELYSGNYSVIFNTGPQARMVLTDVSLKIGSLLNNKNISQVRHLADDIRSDVFANYVTRFSEQREGVLVHLEEIEATIKAHGETRDRLLEKQAELERQRRETLSDIRIESLTVQPGYISGSFSVTNSLSEPINGIAFKLLANLADYPGRYMITFRLNFNYGEINIIFDSPIPAGETRGGIPFPDASRAMRIYHEDGSVVHSRFREGEIAVSDLTPGFLYYDTAEASGRVYGEDPRALRLTRAEEALLQRGYDRSIASCEEAQTNNRRVLPEYESVIAVLEAAVANPSPVTIEQPGRGRGICRPLRPL